MSGLPEMNCLPLCGCPALPGNHVHFPKLTFAESPSWPKAIIVGPAMEGCYRCGYEMRWPIEDKTCPGCHVYHPRKR